MPSGHFQNDLQLVLLAREYKQATGWWPAREDIERVDQSLREDVMLFDAWVEWIEGHDEGILRLRAKKGG
jgi:hypothetical protein